MSFDKTQISVLGGFAIGVFLLAAGVSALIINALPAVNTGLALIPLLTVYGTLMISVWVLLAMFFVIRTKVRRSE
jgi:hypothetical protein